MLPSAHVLVALALSRSRACAVDNEDGKAIQDVAKLDEVVPARITLEGGLAGYKAGGVTAKLDVEVLLPSTFRDTFAVAGQDVLPHTTRAAAKPGRPRFGKRYVPMLEIQTHSLTESPARRMRSVLKRKIFNSGT